MPDDFLESILRTLSGPSVEERVRRVRQERVRFVGGSSLRSIIYELDRDGRFIQPTYPNGSNRDYYQEGDIILTSKHSQRWARNIVRELDDPGPGGTSIYSLIGNLFAPEVIIGWRIERIQAEPNGAGTVMLRRVIGFNDREFILFQERISETRRGLSLRFMNLQSIASTEQLVTYIGYVIDPLIDTLTGRVRGLVLRPLGRRVLAAVARRTTKSLRKKLLKKMTDVTVSATVTLVNELVRNMLTVEARIQAENEARLESNESTEQLRERLLKQAIRRAVEAAVLKIIKKTIGQNASRAMRESLQAYMQINPVLGSTLKQQIAVAVSNRFIEIITVEKFSVLINALERSLEEEDEIHRAESFRNALMQELGGVTGRAVTDVVREVFRGISGN